jgi:hypothetical protein
MKRRRWIGLLVLAMVSFYASASRAQVAVNTSHMDRMGALATHWKSQLGPKVNRLSGAARNFIHLGEQWERVKAMAGTISAARRGGAMGSELAAPHEMAPGSQPNLSFTRFSGAVQSETSTAWCGKHVVVGFNDSGSFWESGGLSFNGYSLSTDGGTTFTDMGFPTVGSANTMMEGDPVLACTGPADFFYASLYEDGSVPGPSGSGFSDISLSTSTDGGTTFGAPTVAIEKDAFYHFLDKPWMTVDLANPSHIFISYTDFDNSNFGAGSPGNTCGASNTNIARTAIELVVSTNGGGSWSSPTVVAAVCGNPFVQGSQVAVDKNTGTVYVAWESFAADFYTREIDIANSTDGGATFSTAVKVSNVNAVGDGDFDYGIQGFIRDFDFPSLAIGKGTHAGTLYITWNDGDNRVPDAWMEEINFLYGIGDGKYGFSDVLFTSSTNGGSSWSSPTKVNGSSAAPADRYQPGVATDRSGAIGVCWYDRHRDANNFLIDRFCGKSTDGGASWTKARLTATSYASVVNQDLLIASDYMGDYDEITAQATGGVTSGFMGSFVNTVKGFQKVIVRAF